MTTLLYLCCAPRNIEDRMFSLLWNEGNRNSVLTSGTMRDDTGLDFFKSENGLNRLEKSKVLEANYSSPFKYGNSRPENEIEITMKKEVAPPPQVDFEAYKGKNRKSGTGGIYNLNDHLYEGRYTPINAYGKRESCNVYAKTYEECEVKLEEMISKKRAEIAAEKERLKAMQTA